MEKPSTPPPMICVNDRLLLQYAVLTDSVGFTAGHGLFFVDGKEIGRVPYLAICEDRESEEPTLYFCGDDWSPIGIAPCASIEAAKRKAERIYPGTSTVGSRRISLRKTPIALLMRSGRPSDAVFVENDQIRIFRHSFRELEAPEFATSAFGNSAAKSAVPKTSLQSLLIAGVALES
jgi:hypothetical protein